MLSIWVQALSCAGHATPAWLGVTEPQVPSAKGLTEPLMNNLFFLFCCLSSNASIIQHDGGQGPFTLFKGKHGKLRHFVVNDRLQLDQIKAKQGLHQ